MRQDYWLLGGTGGRERGGENKTSKFNSKGGCTMQRSSSITGISIITARRQLLLMDNMTAKLFQITKLILACVCFV